MGLSSKAGRGGFPHETNLRRGQGVGLLDEVAEGALQGRDFGGLGKGSAKMWKTFVLTPLLF